jgi:hypothetical protein
MAFIQEREKAVRLGRAIASDIALYNEEKIDQSIATDSFFQALEPELEEGRVLYASRVDPSLDPQQTWYWQAVVNMVLASRGHIPSPMW